MRDFTQEPKLLGISVVKNEQDIIEPFVRHNLQFLDRLIVLDNGSVDRTTEILEELQREYPTLVVGHHDEFGHKQRQRINRMLIEAQSTYQPDFVMPLDADEFLGASDRNTFLEALKSIPCGGCGVLP